MVELTAEISNRILENIRKTGLFNNFNHANFIALGLLVISLIGARGKKDEKLNYKTAFTYIITGLLIYGGSYFSLFVAIPITHLAILYMGLTVTGFILVLTGGTLLSRVIRMQFNNKDTFNKENETFPQEERLLENEYSINLPSKYHLKGKVRKSSINIINPFGSLPVLGSPGSGKPYFVIRHVITQHLAKGFSVFVYGFKFYDLSIIAYHHYLKNKDRFPITPEFYVINFDDLTRSHMLSAGSF